MDTCFRISSWDTPLRVNPNRTAGRFNYSGSPATQYFGLHPLTPWAEQMRFHDLRDIDRLLTMRLRIWAIKDNLELATQITFANATKFGIEPAELVDDDHSACRRLADRIRNDSSTPDTIIVPSAALPGTKNAVIFGERTSIPYSWKPIDPADLPTSVVAERSQPPEGLADLVCFTDTPNPEHEAWSRGHRYDFPELP